MKSSLRRPAGPGFSSLLPARMEDRTTTASKSQEKLSNQENSHSCSSPVRHLIFFKSGLTNPFRPFRFVVEMLHQQTTLYGATLNHHTDCKLWTKYYLIWHSWAEKQCNKYCEISWNSNETPDPVYTGVILDIMLLGFCFFHFRKVILWRNQSAVKLKSQNQLKKLSHTLMRR